MRLSWPKLGSAIFFALLVCGSSWAVLATAPELATPTPTAFLPGNQNATAWATDARGSGYAVRAILGGLSLLADVEQPHRAALLLLAVPAPLTTRETADLGSFLDAGGTVIVADRVGALNPWLSSFGLAISDVRLLDASATPADRVPLAAAATESPFTSVIAEPTGTLVFEDGSNWVPLLRSGPTSYLDVNGNGTVDRLDTPGPHPTGARLRLAAGGTVVVFASESLFLDSVTRSADAQNLAFLRALLDESLTDGGEVLVDESRRGWIQTEPPVVRTLSFMRRIENLPGGLHALVLLLGAATATLVVVAVPALSRLRPHETKIPLLLPHPGSSNDAKAANLEAALEVLAQRTGQDLRQLRTIAPADLATGLAQDPVVRRALLGESLPENEQIQLAKMVQIRNEE